MCFILLWAFVSRHEWLAHGAYCSVLQCVSLQHAATRTFNAHVTTCVSRHKSFRWFVSLTHIFQMFCVCDARPRKASVSVELHRTTKTLEQITEGEIICYPPLYGGFHKHNLNTLRIPRAMHALERYAVSMRMLHTATHCNTLQHSATHCNRHCNTLQLTLQQTAADARYARTLCKLSTHCNTCELHTLSTHCNTCKLHTLSTHGNTCKLHTLSSDTPCQSKCF